jgi:hypothetical protein
MKSPIRLRSEAGLYEIALHYSNDKDEYSVFRAISIDGEIPFSELEAYEFTSTGASRFKNGTLGDEDHGNYLFDLEPERIRFPSAPSSRRSIKRFATFS